MCGRFLPPVLDERAVSGPFGWQVLGAVDQHEQLVAERLHLGDAPLQVLRVLAQQPADVAAGCLALLLEREDLADVVERQAEALGGLDEAQPVGVGVQAVAAGAALRLGQQPDVLVVA